MQSYRRRIVAALAAVAAVALDVAPARAAEVHVEGGAVVYTAAAGEANDFSLSLNKFVGDANRYYVSDRAPITVGPGCATLSFYDEIYCQMPGPSQASADLGDNNDQGSLGAAGTLRGGPGSDKLTGSDTGPQTLDGGPGDDELVGEPAVGCSTGPVSAGAPDDLIGGEGTDEVIYDRNAPSYEISIDGQANDGIAGVNEGDNVRLDVENVNVRSLLCSTRKSVITGSDGPNRLRGPGTLNGMGGNDVLEGDSTDDTLDGGEGDDMLTSFRGNDTLVGGPGDDFLEGGFDDDSLTGGTGKDSFVGDATATNTIGTGNDKIFARDGIGESVSCGPGSDVAELDTLDMVSVDTQNLCEEIKRSSTPAGGAAKRLLSVSGLRLTSANRRLRLTITCNTTDKAGCNGTLRLSATRSVRKGGKLVKTKVALASRVVGLASKRRVTVSVTLSPAGRSLVKRNRRLAVTATTKLRTSAGVKTVTQALTLRR